MEMETTFRVSGTGFGWLVLGSEFAGSLLVAFFSTPLIDAPNR